MFLIPTGDSNVQAKLNPQRVDPGQAASTPLGSFSQLETLEP